MSTPVVTIEAALSCSEVFRIFKDNQLRRAPVADGEITLGMITDRDLHKVMPWTIEEQERRSASGHQVPVRTLLAEHMISVGPNDDIGKAAQLMLRAKIGGLPVLNGNKLVGIITESDIFKLFVRRTLTQRGHRMILSAPKGALQQLNPAQLCVKLGATLFDLGMYPTDKGRTSVVMQVRTNDIQRLVDAFIEQGYELSLLEKN
jgi:CBS-domain-containing membrane protein